MPNPFGNRPIKAQTRSAGDYLSEMAATFLTALPQDSELIPDAAPISTPELLADIAQARRFPEGFRAWAKHWHFRNRETGAQLTFARLWPGQDELSTLMITTAREAMTAGDWRGIFALKAGKLGFTELECCWDGYVLWARRNGRVHLFSKEEDAAKEMLGFVKYGLGQLETAWGVRFLDPALRQVEAEKAGSKQFRITVLAGNVQDFGDVRTLVAYATGKFPAIDQSCMHAHVDEWAHMEDPSAAWGSIGTTIAPSGTGHIVTRGAGEKKAVEDTWAAAQAGQSSLKAFFAAWHQRPDRDRGWYEAQAATLPTLAALSHYAAETPEDAFRGDEDNDFVPIEIWDKRAELACCALGHVRTPRQLGVDTVPPADAWQPENCAACREAEATGRYHSYLRTHPLQPGPNGPTMILGADAGTSHDTFGVVGVTRHPLRPDDPAIRVRRLWTPEEFEDGQIDYATVEAWIRAICEGGCALGHPQYLPWKGGGQCKPRKGQTWEPGECPACAAGELVPAFNVYQLAFDPWQLTQMSQALTRDGVTWVKDFSQGIERGSADRTLLDVIVGGRLGHTGDDMLRLHIGNAKAKTSKDEESKLRLVKKAPHRKIDLAVAASMAVSECLRLNL